MIINITYKGESTEHSLMLDDIDLDDAYIRSLSEEIRDLPRGSLDFYVVDRMPVPAGGEPRFYVRPKVPFGAKRPGMIGAGPGVMDVHEVMVHDTVSRLRSQLDIAVEALLQYSTSPTSGLRAQEALAEIASLDEPDQEHLS